MAQNLHTVDVIAGSDPIAFGDRLLVYMRKSLANPAGSGAGAAVVVPLGSLNLPPNAMVFAAPSQDATCYITRPGGVLTVNLAPRLATSTLVAGTFDLLILA